jgi:hypothetical protein
MGTEGTSPQPHSFPGFPPRGSNREVTSDGGTDWVLAENYESETYRFRADRSQTIYWGLAADYLNQPATSVEPVQTQPCAPQATRNYFNAVLHPWLEAELTASRQDRG